MSLKRLIAPVLFGCFFLSSPVEGVEAVLPGEIRLEATAVHPFFRTDAFPANLEVDVNPVTFYWPSTRIEFTEPLLQYDFQLSKDRSFLSMIEEVKGQNPSFYVAKARLPKGTFYWRYRLSGGTWSEAYAFSVGFSTREDQRPSTQTFLSNVKGDFPRIVIRKERLPQVRKEFKERGITESIVAETSKYFEVELPDKEWGGKFYKNGKRVFSNGKFPDDHVKSMITAPVWNGAVVSLCRAYLLTEEEKYAKEALRWGMKVTTFEVLPNVLTYDGNPFPDGFDFSFYLDVVSTLYDALHDYMTPAQKEVVRKNLAERLAIYYKYYCNRVENRCIDNHTWQISLGSYIRAAIIANGEIPEAGKYLAYGYDIWTARDPEQSRTDGGWFGGGYVGVNIGVWTEVPVYFRTYTGYNFYEHPYYQNHPYWFLYRQMPGSKEDGFSGDGYGDEITDLAPQMKMWLNVLDADINSPVAGWLGSGLKENKKYATFAWARQTEGMPLSNSRKADKPKDLPQARAFRDVGVVNMHTDLLHPQNDLHVAFRSSPYGTFGHNLASHNAFNILYQGDYLFVPYGHRHGGAKNSVACYRHTRGHNSVLIDGKGQPFSPEAYGWIPRFLHGEKISYVCGDASRAYDAAPFGREDDFFERAGLKKEDHISQGVMKRYRRHLLFLRPSLIVVYDELEAKQPVRWDWVLHCRRMMTAQGNRLRVEGVPASVEIYSSSPMKAEVFTQPMFLPINVDGRGGEEAGEPYPVKGSYANVSTTQKKESLRIVSLVQVGALNEIKESVPGTYQCGDWTIVSEIDPTKMANLKVTHRDGTTFVLKTPEKGESLLREKINGTLKEMRVVDELPYAARGLKQSSNL